VGIDGAAVGDAAARESGVVDATLLAVDVAVGTTSVRRQAANRPAAVLISRPTNERREIGRAWIGSFSAR
jgi:hypothetical protein